jgi:hypothetical protein
MSTIEVGGGEAPPSTGERQLRVKKNSIGAAELKEEKASKNKGAAIAKQRAQGRAKGDTTHSIDRGTGAKGARAESQIHVIDRGPKSTWHRAYALPSFPDPEGFTLCWIARHRRRHGDDVNLLASMREGWQFVHPDELEEEDIPTETFTGRLAKHGEVVGDETTILMKMPDHMKAQRDAYYNQRRDIATRAVRKRKPGIAEANSKMPLVIDQNDISEESVQMRARRAPRRDADDADDT